MTFPISPRNYEFYILLQFSTTELEHLSLEEGHLRVTQRQLLKLTAVWELIGNVSAEI